MEKLAKLPDTYGEYYFAVLFPHLFRYACQHYFNCRSKITPYKPVVFAMKLAGNLQHHEIAKEFQEEANQPQPRVSK